MPAPSDLQRALLSWGDRYRRDLPWRHTRDPWEIHVSEVMLQQTQVDRVIPKWLAFLERFPTVGSCATAPASAVIELWDGLGYNRRALLLHRAAQRVAALDGGRYPATLADLLVLPGVGPYTARAILAFAFEHDVAVVDTNVGRILARIEGRPLTIAEAQGQADDLVPIGEGWAWNQTLLDLGATVCGKKVWSCGSCPLRGWCSWAGDGADPATGSAAVSAGQSRFDGSDRQGRGRLVAALRHGPVTCDRVAITMGWPDDPDRADRVLASLIGDGMVQRVDDVLRLPS